MTDATFEPDRCAFSKPGRFASGAGIATLPVTDYFSGAPQPAYLAYSCYVAAIPFNTELKILVGIETLWVDDKFSHNAIGVIQNRAAAVNLAQSTLTCVACVPIHFASDVHDDRQHNEERDGAHEQRVILLPQSDVQKQVNTSTDRKSVM